ncbi:MAG: metal dependent phosphohydrolase [uncultured bacterium]|nr:MAG: metal dependent phosphohydrolase [uncultured bacterium]
MDNKYQKIQELAVEILKRVVRKDYILHTLTVTKAMEMLIEKEGGEPDILIPVALCHDLGWRDVPEELQMPNLSKEDYRKSIEQHLVKNPPVTQEVLEKAGYSQSKIDHIIKIILAHKFADPNTLDLEQKMLIDADTLSDVFKEQFYSDAKAYKRTPEEMLEFRGKNTYFTKTANKIFNRELEERRREIKLVKK